MINKVVVDSVSNKLLEYIGLTENEKIVYLAYLKYGENLASHVAEVMKMDKSSVYNASTSLVDKKLLLVNKRSRGTTYLAVDPEYIKEIVKKKELELLETKNSLDGFISQLKNMAAILPHKSFIEIEYGYDAHKQAMLDTLECKEKFIRMKTNAKSPIFDNQQHLDLMNNYYFEERIKRKIYLHQLFQYRESYPLDKMNVTNPKFFKEMRILPDTFKIYESFKIFDDNVYITVFEEGKEPAIIKIRDAGVAKLMKELFDFVWSHSVVYYGNSVVKSISLKSGDKVSRIGIGTRGVAAWDSAGKVYTFRNPYFEENFTKEALGYFLSQGVNYIDLCLKYAQGRSVETVSKLIENYPRRNLIISGKFTRLNEVPISNKNEIEKQCDAYLKILKTDYLDSFQIHSPRVMDFSIEETVEAIDRLIEKGKVRNLSVSNFDILQLKSAMQVSKYGVILNEIPYNLFERAYEKDGTIDFMQKNKIASLFVRVLGLGRLCGLEEDIDAPEIMKELMKKYGRTSAQIALAWVLNKYPKDSFVILKSENPAHIHENIAALDLKLDKKDMKQLEALSDFGAIRLESVRIKA